MQTASIFSLILIFVIATVGCSSSKSTKTNDPKVITDEEIIETNAVNLNELIAKRVPGVSITQTPDGFIKARLRGQSSFSGNDTPLFVVDGFPTEPNPDGSLPGILITEIKSIEVLNTPTETVEYGMRGAHGVILVETKKGRGN